MAIVNLPLIGPTYTNRSLPVGAQQTQNFYVTVNAQGGEQLSFQPFPGLKAFAAGTAYSRGTGVLNGVLHEVMGTTLNRVASDGTVTSVGTIEGAGRCSLESDGTNLVIATGAGKPYTYDGTTLTQGTDIDLPNASTVKYINSRVVYDGNNGDIVFSDLNDPLTVDSLNVMSAESKPDDMKAVHTHKQQLYCFGDKTIQPAYNDASAGSPPYRFALNATQEIGVDAIHSISSNNNAMYFLGSDLNIYQYTGLTQNPVGNPAIGQAIERYTATSDAFGECFTIDNMNFYLISFPTANETWLYSEGAGVWTNLAHGDGDQHLISSYEYVYGKHLVSDRRNGNIYELDFDTFTDNGETIHRQRDTISINGGTFGRPGATVFMNNLRLEIESGTSLVTAESQIIMQYSDDNGRSWSAERWLSIGEQGEYAHELVWWGLGTFKSRMFRFKMTDAIKWVLIKLSADVELDNA